MAGSIIPKFEKNRIAATWAAENLYAMLLKDTHVQNEASQQFISQVSANEVTDTGGVYTAGGFKLTGNTAGYDTNNAYLDFTGNPAIGPGAYLDYRYIAIYVNTGNPATSRILCIIDMLLNQIVTNGTSTITWNALGVIYIT
jgi:phosphate-selective porin